MFAQGFKKIAIAAPIAPITRALAKPLTAKGFAAGIGKAEAAGGKGILAGGKNYSQSLQHINAQPTAQASRLSAKLEKSRAGSQPVKPPTTSAPVTPPAAASKPAGGMNWRHLAGAGIAGYAAKSTLGGNQQ